MQTRELVRYVLREASRRRVFHVVAVLSVLTLSLYAFGIHQFFAHPDNFLPKGEGQNPLKPDPKLIAAATLFGLGLFVLQFIGATLAAFLTLGVARGDAESGLLQPIVVRPIGRVKLLTVRFATAASLCMLYSLTMYGVLVLVVGLASGWTPDHPFVVGIDLALGSMVIAAIGTLGSGFLSPLANGISTLMLFGAGIFAGLLTQVGEGIGSQRLLDVGTTASRAVPFEALYQAGLHELTSDTHGATQVIVQLGPFGGAHRAGPALYAWVVVYLVVLVSITAWRFRRSDL
jgi:ABC-type transport system involved in multi-copper enzyme maturation permease subunit